MTNDELLAHSEIDAIYIPLPSGVRNEFIKKAIAAGKHIYSEKPHSGTIAELKSLLDACAAAGLQWMDGTMWYHSNRTKAIEAKLRELGPVQRVSAAFSWGSGLFDQKFIDGGNLRTDKTREPFGLLGDSGHYPISAIMMAFGWVLPTRVQALYTKKNNIDTIITIEAFLLFPNGGRAVLDTTCEGPYRSQFEIMCENGVIKVDDLVGGQGRLDIADDPFVGSWSYTLGDARGRDKIVTVEACDHCKLLVEAFANAVTSIKAGSQPDPEWAKRSLATHTVMWAIFESSENDGAIVELDGD